MYSNRNILLRRLAYIALVIFTLPIAARIYKTSKPDKNKPLGVGELLKLWVEKNIWVNVNTTLSKKMYKIKFTEF